MAQTAPENDALKTISGLLKPKNGDIVYEGASIAGKAAQMIVKQGISHVPEGRRVFANMTVEENLELGAFLRKDKRAFNRTLLRCLSCSRALKSGASSWPARSGGEQQMLAIGRALMARPKLCFWTSCRWARPLLVKTIFRIIEEINESGTTILLVEQNAHMALSIAARAYVIESGRVVYREQRANCRRANK
ncbi:ATP-binding cassette domain-containing protein [Bacillus megaterium]|nr:ATP-binding cassette domain-containing protein [Priestia megaterium]